MLSRADIRPAEHSAVSGTGAHSGLADLYLTDEVFLYRIVGTIGTDAAEVVELEDCYWLDVVRVPMSDLRSRRLRVVIPTR